MQNKRMNFRGLAFALIFLCNPNISIIDPLPDFIGYIIISLSLVKFADMMSKTATKSASKQIADVIGWPVRNGEYSLQQ